MPATPPTVFSPPAVPTPSAPGAVHAVPSASPAAPGAVHAVPSSGGGVAQVFSITAVGTAAEDGFVRVTYSFMTFSGELNVDVANGDSPTVWAGKIKSDLEAVPGITANFAITQDGATLHLTYVVAGVALSMVLNYTAFAFGASNSTGAVSTPASAGGVISPPAIHTLPGASVDMTNYVLVLINISPVTVFGGVQNVGMNYLYAGSNEWRAFLHPSRNRVYYESGYWYISQRNVISDSFSYGEPDLLWRAAATIEEDPTTLTYVHAPGSGGSGGAWGISQIPGTYTPSITTPPAIHTAPAATPATPPAITP